MLRSDVETQPTAKVSRARARKPRSGEAVYPVMDYIADMAGQLATMAGFADDAVLAGMLNAAAVHARAKAAA